MTMNIFTIKPRIIKGITLCKNDFLLILCRNVSIAQLEPIGAHKAQYNNFFSDILGKFLIALTLSTP